MLCACGKSQTGYDPLSGVETTFITGSCGRKVEVPKTDAPEEEPDDAEQPGEDGEAGQTETGGESGGSKEQSGNAAAAETPQADGSEKGQMIPLSAELSALLEQLGSDQGQQADTPQNQADSAPTAEPEDNRAILLYTGLGALAVCLCGAAAETIYFKRERAR